MLVQQIESILTGWHLADILMRMRGAIGRCLSALGKQTELRHTRLAGGLIGFSLCGVF